MITVYIILAVAFLLRLASFGFGFPIEVYGDELSNTIIAFKVLASKSIFIPYEAGAFLPPLLSYILMPVFAAIGGLGIFFDIFKNLADFMGFVILNREWFLTPARIVSAIFGTATVYFLYLFAEKMFNRKIALLSAFLLAVDFLHVHNSQIGHIWAPLTFFIVALAYFSYRLSLTGERKWYWLSALAIGLGYAIGQIPIVYYPVFLLIHYYHIRKTGKKFFNNDFILSTVVVFGIVAVFSILNFYSFYKHFYDVVLAFSKLFGLEIWSSEKYPWVREHLVNHYSFFGNWAIAFKNIFYTNPIVAIVAFFGFFIILKKFKPSDPKNIFLVFVPFGYLLLSVLLYYNFHYRYVLPVVPFLVVSASYFVFFLRDKVALLNKKNTLFILLVVIIVAYSVISSFLYSSKFLKPYTVVQGIDWAYANIPQGARIVSGIYLNTDKEGIKFGEKYNKYSWVDTRKKYLLGLDEQEYPKPNYFLINPNITDVYNLPKEEKKADYFFITFYNKEKEAEQLKTMNEFEGKKELIAKFYPKERKTDMKNLLGFEPQWVGKSVFEIKNLGPYVEIYKTIK